jgi:hypothetical protein
MQDPRLTIFLKLVYQALMLLAKGMERELGCGHKKGTD